MKALVIYHANCVDGFTAAWAAWTGLNDGAEYLSARYGDAPPDVTGRDVIVVDFSYPRQVLLEMRANAKTLQVFDHHKTAQADLEGLDFCVFDMDRSGAGMAWDYLRTLPDSAPRLRLIDYVEDRDLWRWKLPHSREISAYIALCERTFEAWTKLAGELEDRFATVVDKGATALRVTEQYVETQRERASRVSFAGYEVPIINTTFCVSELVGALAEDEPFAIGWFEREDGQVVYSLRSRGDGVDVSKIAKSCGGGGHRNAAGFTSSEPVHRMWRI